MSQFSPACARRLGRFAIAASVFAAAGLAHAANPSMLNDFKFNAPTFIHQKPFADEHLVIQVSEDDPKLWNLALNNAQNVLDYVGDDKAQVVIVTYGPGLKMLLKNSPVAQRIASEDAEGIEFDACHNTMKSMERKTGHMPALTPQAVVVPAGVVRIMQLEHAGFEYIKP